MSTLPEHLRYTREHEWVNFDQTNGSATIGVTAYAAAQLGDVVFLELPAVDDDVTQGQPMGEIESTKSVSDLHSPVSGHVAEVNQDALDAPEVVNSDAYEQGWLIRVSCEELPGDLLSADEYRELIGE